MKTTPCKGCGKPIVWGTTKDGKNIPLDPKPPVYAVVGIEYPPHIQEVIRIQRLDSIDKVHEPGGLRHAPTKKDRVEPYVMAAYVSHFATCPKANDFSASKRKAKA